MAVGLYVMLISLLGVQILPGHGYRMHPNQPSANDLLWQPDTLNYHALYQTYRENMLLMGKNFASGFLKIPRYRPCPCANSSWCDVIKTEPKIGQELFVFSVDSRNWAHYDWNRVTTVGAFFKPNDTAMCLAHRNGARIVFGANIPKAQLVNSTARALWVQHTVNYMTYNFADGVNMDFEDGISANETLYRDGLTDLMKSLVTAVKQISPYKQISIDFASSPSNQWRQFDYKALLNIVDLAFIMDYDLIGSKYGYADANSPYTVVSAGVKEFLTIAPAHKLVIGLPWYGYWFKCDTYDQQSHKCARTQFGQITYSRLVPLMSEFSSTGRLWDDISKSPYFTLHDPITRELYQIWYDDPDSLRIKFALVKELGLRGSGNWQADAIDYNNSTQIQEMWGAFPS